MNTYLGAAQDLHPNDIDPDAIASSRIVYLEGYLWDPPHAKDAFLKAAKAAHGAERDVALTLSDAFCVDRYRGEFLDLIRSGTVDLVFANERELHSLYQTADFDTALNGVRSDAKLAVITRSEQGCLVVTRSETDLVPQVRSSGWSMQPARGTCSPPDFWSGWPRVRLSQLRATRRAGGGRGHPASRGPSRIFAEGPWSGKRLRPLRITRRYSGPCCYGGRSERAFGSAGNQLGIQLRYLAFLCRRPRARHGSRAQRGGRPATV